MSTPEGMTSLRTIPSDSSKKSNVSPLPQFLSYLLDFIPEVSLIIAPGNSISIL